MRVQGTFKDASFSYDGRMVVSFYVDDKEKAASELEYIKDEKLIIQAKKYRTHRSLDANAYFWQLIDKMAKKLMTDKWTMYLQMIRDYGVFVDLITTDQAYLELKKQFRYLEVLDAEDEKLFIRCYFGSSTYDTEHMSNLIDGTVREAKEIGIETMTPDEIKHMMQAWKPKGDY